ncbi:MAG: gliding motility-associated C-terminal domain-containing protein [Bacteroidales bacterium]|nr:gliding motility-associated C-terminal domain-containing protein [Bacteroidales bacterium]
MKKASMLYKTLLLLPILAISLMTSAQEVSCEITCSETMPVCSEAPVTLSVPNDYLHRYYWRPGGATTSSVIVSPATTTTYEVVVSDTAGVELCNASFTVEVLPRFETQVNQLRLTCNNNQMDNGKTAQIKAEASGVGEPYTYFWEEQSGSRWKELSPMHIAPTDPSVAIGLQAYHWYRVKIEDSRGCVQYDSIYTRAFPTPVVEITCDPSDTVYIQNPDVTFSFENLSQDSISIDHFFWTFEHGLTSTQEEPVFTYVETGSYQASLTVYDEYDCDTVYLKDVYVNPVKLSIPSVFTPNGDGINDTFVISLGSGSDTPGSNNDVTRGRDGNEGDVRPLNEYYKSTDLMIMNRWGRIVYHSTDYQNDWDGGGLSDGTYFYVLKCNGLKEEIQYQGAVMIVTKSRQ